MYGQMLEHIVPFLSCSYASSLHLLEVLNEQINADDDGDDDDDEYAIDG